MSLHSFQQGPSQGIEANSIRSIGEATFIMLPTPEEVAVVAAMKLGQFIKDDPAGVLGLATGGTMVEPYRVLVELISSQSLKVDELTTFNLDEYYPISVENEASYRSYMNTHLFIPARFPLTPANGAQWGKTYVPYCPSEGDIEDFCDEYERAIIAAGGVGLQLLGIGENGHIGFNEPGSSADSITRIVPLDPSTRAANARFFSTPEEVPTHAITMGLSTIMASEEVLLVATGHKKIDAIKHAFFSPPTPEIPASILQHHSKVTVIIDEEIGKALPFK